jgi:hypothetical protein
MNFDPQKFFIRPVGFFSMLLVCALTWLLSCEVSPAALGNRHATFEDAQARAAFLFANCFLGRLVFLLGSCLDDFYDWATLHAEYAGREARPLSDLADVQELSLSRLDRASKIKLQVLGSRSVEPLSGVVTGMNRSHKEKSAKESLSCHK